MQTYQEKLRLVVEDIKSTQTTSFVGEIISPLTLLEYHEIISKENVILVSSPVFSFDVIELTPSFASETLKLPRLSTDEVVLNASICKFDNFSDLIISPDHLYFFYTLGNCLGKYHIRFTKIPLEILKDSIERLESVRRMNTNLALQLPEIRDYINSETFKKDHEIVSQDVNDLRKKILLSFMEWKDNPQGVNLSC
jgi:hypothetical protein